MPQRVTQINPQLIDEANNQLPAASDFAVQLDRGNLIGRLLLPYGLARSHHASRRAACHHGRRNDGSHSLGNDLARAGVSGESALISIVFWAPHAG